MKKAVLLKIKNGKKAIWENWCTELSTKLRSEAELTLAEEKVIQELTLSFSLHDEDYVIGYMDGECLPANMDRKINQKHQEIKSECLTRVGDVTVLLDLKA